MISVEFVDPLVQPRWNDWIAEFPNSDSFHSAEWARVLFEAYGYRPVYGLIRNGGSLAGIVPLADVRSPFTGNRGVGLPFSDTCPPLVQQGVSLADARSALLDLGRRRGWGYIELRGSPAETLAGAVPSAEFFSHDLQLQGDEQAQFGRLKDSNRRSIRKALQSQVEIQTLRTPAAMDDYYRLHCLTRRRHGLPPQPLHFFRAIQQNLIGPPGRGFVQLARHEGKWIAGAVFLGFERRAIFKFGASDLTYQHLRPTNLLMWETIRLLRDQGFESMSFGRTDLTDTGLLQFKRAWGGIEQRVSYFRLSMTKTIARKATVRQSGRMSEIARHLPIPLLRAAGALIYPHLG